MCWDNEGNFVGCYAPEYCNPTDEQIAAWDREDDRHAEEEPEEVK